VSEPLKPGMHVWALSLLVVAGGFFAAEGFAAATGKLVQRTDSGVVVMLDPPPEIVIGQRQAWRLRLSQAGEASPEPLSVRVNGGMPGHGHGFPEPPAVTATRAPGQYQVMMRLNMGGAWEVRVDLGWAESLESVAFELNIGEPTAETRANHSVSESELALLRTLHIRTLQPARRDPSNRLSGNAEAIGLGELLFADTDLSGSGQVACATCHDPDHYFADPRGESTGSAPLAHNAPSLLGAAQGEWFYWDGRRDSLWAQAITPLETRGEMDASRVGVVRYVWGHPTYGPVIRRLSTASVDQALLTALPSQAGPFAPGRGRSDWERLTEQQRVSINAAFSDIGKVLAAYEETLRPGPSRFDRFVESHLDGGDGAEWLSDDELAGLKLFIDPAQTQCLRCHNGPLFTNQGFHAVGSAAHAMDLGRQLGLAAARFDPFNCTGTYSDAEAGDCALSAVRGVSPGEFAGAFKVPGLRNVAETAPYMHDGRFQRLAEVMEFYRQPPQNGPMGHELSPLELTDREIEQLIAFLRTLTEE